MNNHPSFPRFGRIFLLVFFLFACQGTAHAAGYDLAAILQKVLEFPNQIGNLDDILELFTELAPGEILSGPGYNCVSAVNNPLPNPKPIVAAKIPKAADEAIFDFKKTLAKSFIKYAGSPDAGMNRSQFSALANAGNLPFKEDPDEYFQTHDKDRDGKLSIGEFIPSSQEIADKQDLEVLTEAFTTGIPYPNGNTPLVPPSTQPPPPLILTPSDVEKRITAFARQQGLITVRDPQGRLQLATQAGVPVPMPPGIIPLPLNDAMRELEGFARSLGGQAILPPQGNPPLVKDGDGNVIPPNRWPPPLRPPYLAPNAPPPPGP